MAITQTDRAGILTTSLGENALGLSRLDATEGLSQLFEFRIEALGEQSSIDFNPALGLGASVKIQAADGATRVFHGVLTEARWAGSRQEYYVYRLVLRPWFWLLRRTANSRIFSGKDPIDIITQIFTEKGFSAYRDATSEDRPNLEYCVQYQETDYNFICRMMEHYGIYYFFEHSEDAHTLVLADGKSSHETNPSLPSVQFNSSHGGGRQEQQQIEGWAIDRSAQTGVFTMGDYGYKKPSADLQAQEQNPGGYAHDSMEIFNYSYSYVDTEGNELTDRDVGQSFAKYRSQQAQSMDFRRSATGTAASLFSGTLVTLEDAPIASENLEYLVLQCSHFIESHAYRSGVGGGGERPYTGHYQLTPSSRPFRAPFVTVKPRIAGPQSALVVGQSGEEIDVDDLGRILVQFYWDREKSSSRRVRVAQIWAGSQRGALFVPRIGDEVLVQYEDGDPDRPIVVGSVYNGTNTVPMNLPSKKTQFGILTKSSKNSSGYNMLMFDDTDSSERVMLRAQKDLKVKALNDEVRVIGVDQTEDIGNNLTQTVKGDKSVTVGEKGGTYTMTASKKIVLTVGQSTITMDPTSITLQSPMISINGDVSVSVSAPAVSIDGDAEVSITSPATSISG